MSTPDPYVDTAWRRRNFRNERPGLHESLFRNNARSISFRQCLGIAVFPRCVWHMCCCGNRTCKLLDLARYMSVFLCKIALKARAHHHIQSQASPQNVAGRRELNLVEQFQKVQSSEDTAMVSLLAIICPTASSVGLAGSGSDSICRAGLNARGIRLVLKVLVKGTCRQRLGRGT